MAATIRSYDGKRPELGRGVFLAQISDGTRREPLARTLLAVTDLAPTLKAGSTDGLVWVSYSTSASASAVLSRIHQLTGFNPL